MESIDEYFEEINESFSYQVNGEEACLTDFDGVAVPTEGGDEVFLGWRLDYRDGSQVVLSEDTPGMVKELELEELKHRLLSERYTPVQRVEDGYRKAEING